MAIFGIGRGGGGETSATGEATPAPSRSVINKNNICQQLLMKADYTSVFSYLSRPEIGKARHLYLRVDEPPLVGQDGKIDMGKRQDKLLQLCGFKPEDDDPLVFKPKAAKETLTPGSISMERTAAKKEFSDPWGDVLETGKRDVLKGSSPQDRLKAERARSHSVAGPLRLIGDFSRTVDDKMPRNIELQIKASKMLLGNGELVTEATQAIKDYQDGKQLKPEQELIITALYAYDSAITEVRLGSLIKNINQFSQLSETQDKTLRDTLQRLSLAKQTIDELPVAMKAQQAASASTTRGALESWGNP